MKIIGLLSDTHSYLHPSIFNHFKNCDEIWHAGDIGNITIIKELENFKTLKAVYGNIDGTEIRKIHPEHLRFMCEEVDVWMTHIGGYPNHYSPLIRDKIQQNPPQLFICGHSHILKVIYDKKLKLLHINPGAAGKQGFHQKITLVKFMINGKSIENLQIIELGDKY